jgi:hypothetical protein
MEALYKITTNVDHVRVCAITTVQNRVSVEVFTYLTPPEPSDEPIPEWPETDPEPDPAHDLLRDMLALRRQVYEVFWRTRPRVGETPT